LNEIVRLAEGFLEGEGEPIIFGKRKNDHRLKKPLSAEIGVHIYSIQLAALILTVNSTYAIISKNGDRQGDI
jgi:hypothetical protein